MDPYLKRDSLTAAMGLWRFPLHFIDFETAAPPLPFHAGQRPYQPVLFQFSHHVLDAAGSLRHATECLIANTHGSPSVEVVRRLRQALNSDQGTVLHWYPHEKTILRNVKDEITTGNDSDGAELEGFLDELGVEKDATGRLFDLGRLVADQVFLSGTGASSSMKKFLPALIRDSSYVRQKYAQPIYGTATIPSHNFNGQTWVRIKDGAPLDPYKLLNPLFEDAELVDALERLELSEGDVIANGAAAMIAYGRLQEVSIPSNDRPRLEAQLKRYCELDTLAMVMVYEALREWVR